MGTQVIFNAFTYNYTVSKKVDFSPISCENTIPICTHEIDTFKVNSRYRNSNYIYGKTIEINFQIFDEFFFLHLFISLGTGVTSRLGQILSAKEELKPKGYILEAPFNCMKDEVESFKASRILTMLGMKVESILDGSDMLFDNALWLPQIQEPILILHAKDDEVIPFELAKRLFENTKIQKENIEFIPFEANLQLRHDGIFKAIKTNLAIVTDFVQKVLSN